MTFACLKAFGTVSDMIDILIMCVTGTTIWSAASRRKRDETASKPTALLGFTLNTFQLGQVSLDRIEDIFQSEPKIKNSKSDITPNKMNSSIVP